MDVVGCTCIAMSISSCDRSWEKGRFRVVAEFVFSITHNFEAVIATVLKPGIVILWSLLCTRWNFLPPPTSCMGVAIASITHGQKSAVLCLALELHRFR